MVTFYAIGNQLFAVKSTEVIDDQNTLKLSWLFGQASRLSGPVIAGQFVGPRREMITPWSTNAVEITQNMGIEGIERIELFYPADKFPGQFDAMLQAHYESLDQEVFTIHHTPDNIVYVEDIDAYNQQEGLALSTEEVDYLHGLSTKLNRKLTDSEIFGFSQVNSEHCRHKIFNGKFVLDGQEQELSLFELIKKTTKLHPNLVVSAYKDNCAFLEGPEIRQFSPITHDKPDYFRFKTVRSVLSLKAETHNFPTTVEPFNGAATGTGGEIRDRVAGGKGAIPLAGTAVYMTAYPRLHGGRAWEKKIPARPWLYQTPEQILIKASNGASDFGNKFGQPLICGSLFTFEHNEKDRAWAFDKVIMMAGGIGSGNRQYSQKDKPGKGDSIIMLGGDNYRIGMGGGAVSSVSTGEYGHAIEMNAVQRSNPEMQKRICNAIRAMAESDKNPIISIHDHGAGGHLNCFSELVETTGGSIAIDSLPIGDPTLSAKEIIGNESQERMGLVMSPKDTAWLKRVANRERAPLYVVGETTGDHQFTFHDNNGIKPIDLQLEDIFGNPPKTILRDITLPQDFKEPSYHPGRLDEYLKNLLQLESVACKDWLTNKVDRSVTGLVARQQTCGPIQLPLSDLAVSALDYTGYSGIATAIGHAPAAGLIDPANGAVLSIAEALTNIVWAPVRNGIKGISLSANWMWPCKKPGEDIRLYAAVKAASDFAVSLEINIPTGKDSLSMTQKYPDGTEVYAPGTVIISAAGEVTDFRKVVWPVIVEEEDSIFLYIDFSQDDFNLGGSSFYQSLNTVGKTSATVKDPAYFRSAFNAVQHLILQGMVLSGHDISSGGLAVTLLEMCFARESAGVEADFNGFEEPDLLRILFSEKPAVVIQVKAHSPAPEYLKKLGIRFEQIGKYCARPIITIRKSSKTIQWNISQLRDEWFTTSYWLDRNQCGPQLAEKRFDQYKKQPLHFVFPSQFNGSFSQYGIEPIRMEQSGIKAAIIREKGVNGDREMAFMMHLAGFDVKDVHMTDLMSGRENLDDIHLIVFVGGFSNSDVLGSAKGWAGAFRYNELAGNTLKEFYERKDTLSLGVCNGCQLMVELNLINPEHEQSSRLEFNESHKFESAFINVNIPENNSVMLGSLGGSRLGIWVAHGEGRFRFPYAEEKYCVALKYAYTEYPGNPNGSDYAVAGICSADGRHLAVMPHLERAIYPWNWAYYPENRKNDIISPWIEAFVNAREWIKGKL